MSTTGGHDWYPISSKVKYLKDEKAVRLLKFGSWVTSAGYADFYSIMTVSPTFEGSYENMSLFVVYKVSGRRVETLGFFYVRGENWPA